MNWDARVKMCGFWSGVLFLVLWLVGFWAFAQWVPPLSPAAGAAAIGAEFVHRSVAIRIAMAFMGVGSIFYLPFILLIADYIKKIEGPNSSMLSRTQLVGGIVGQITFFIPSFIWAAAAFRPDRDPAIILAMSDVAWLTFMTAWPPFFLQFASLGIAIFMDRSPTPVFPRWAGYLQFWISLSFFPATLALFFKTGPFAWDGFFIWWLPLSVFVIWFIVMLALLRKAIRNEAAATA